MAKINSALLAAIIKKTGLGQAQVYSLIGATARKEFLSRNLAALKYGASVGVTITKYARADELAQLRNGGTPAISPAVMTVGDRPADIKRKPVKQSSRATPNSVFVVHGRDTAAKDSMFAFLRSIGIKPIEWTSALQMSKKASPYIGEVLNAAFARARAVVVLMTPDDVAQLRTDLLLPTDKPYERILTGQPRPNVLFESGMAFATHADRTVIVQLGTVREFSDIGGRHIVHMSNEFSKRQELVLKLKSAGCDVDTSGADWVKAGDFVDPLGRPTKAKRK